MSETQSSFGEFVRAFIDMNILRNKHYHSGEIGKANKLSKDVTKLFARYEEDSEQFRSILLMLIADERECVALDAAALGLWHVPDAAEKRLESLQLAKEWEDRSTAKVTLEEWRAGRLKPWWRERWPKKG